MSKPSYELYVDGDLAGTYSELAPCVLFGFYSFTVTDDVRIRRLNCPLTDEEFYEKAREVLDRVFP